MANCLAVHLFALVLICCQLWRTAECLREGQCEGMSKFNVNHFSGRLLDKDLIFDSFDSLCRSYQQIDQ